MIKLSRPTPSASRTSLSLEDLTALKARAQGLDWQRAFVGPQLLGGNRLSRLRGGGLDFEELKNYQQGDDIRHMDWKVSLRSGRPHVRIFNEEKEQRIQLLIDQRSSMWFGSRAELKANVALQLAALLAWDAWGRGDRLGSCVFDGSEQRPSASSRSPSLGLQQFQQWLALHRRLRPGRASPAQPLLAALDWSLSGAARGQVVYLISDLAGLERSEQLRAQFSQRLSALARHNQLRCLFIYDPLEQSLPPAGQLPISDGREHAMIDSGASEARRRYAELLPQKLAPLQALAAASANIGVLAVHTAAPVWQQLQQMQPERGDG